MKSRLFPAMFCVFAMVLLSAAVALAQEAPAAADADPLEDEGVEEETWDSYAVKAYTIQVFGGLFGGDTYLELPVMGDQTEVEEGIQRVMSFDGDWWELDELDYTIYDGPTKTIEDGQTAGICIGTYLADSFHLDLSLAYTKTEALLTMVNTEDPDNLVVEEIDRDTDVTVLRGALKAMYDLNQVDFFGIRPYLGFGFGGVITRFSELDDVGGLFLVGTAGMSRKFGDTASVFAQFDLTTFAMSRDELEYTKTVTFTDMVMGVSFYLDRVPEDIRARHDAEVAEQKSSRRGH